VFETIYDRADPFRVIDATHHVLVSQPDKASKKLAEVLTELVKTVEMLDAKMVRYLSLYFHSDESIERGRAVLLGMEVGQSIIRINEARGPCHDFKHVYDARLSMSGSTSYLSSPLLSGMTLRTTFERLGIARMHTAARLRSLQADFIQASKTN